MMDAAGQGAAAVLTFPALTLAALCAFARGVLLCYAMRIISTLPTFLPSDEPRWL